MTHQESLYGKTPDQLAALCGELGMPRFAARQIARWLYVRHTEDPLRMTDIAAAHRQRLAERFSPALSAPERVTESADGTKKYLFRTLEGHYVESAYIPDGERATLCVSSQAGCRMGCRFCATGRQGLQQSLTAAEILNQSGFAARARQTDERRVHGHGRTARQRGARCMRIARDTDRRLGLRLVSPTRITRVDGRASMPAIAGVSATRRRCTWPSACTTRFHAERMEMMPVERAWPIAEVAAILREYDFTHQRRVSVRIHRVCAGSTTPPRHMPRTDAPAERHQMPHQPDPLPRGFPTRPTSRPATRRWSASATR